MRRPFIWLVMVRFIRTVVVIIERKHVYFYANNYFCTARIHIIPLVFIAARCKKDQTHVYFYLKKIFGSLYFKPHSISRAELSAPPVVLASSGEPVMKLLPYNPTWSPTVYFVLEQPDSNLTRVDHCPVSSKIWVLQSGVLCNLGYVILPSPHT